MKKQKRKRLTHNSRRISALNFIIWGVGLLLIALLIFNLTYTPPLKQESAESLLVKAEKAKYEEVAAQYPGYRDAYIKLAILAWKTGDDGGAKKYLEKALELDPNNETAKRLKQTLKIY